MGRSRSELQDEEVPPPYVIAEPERTLDRGPSAREGREGRETWPERRRDDVNLGDMLRGRDGGSINKPPGYEERGVTRRDET
jgi:hypothetical protein